MEKLIHSAEGELIADGPQFDVGDKFILNDAGLIHYGHARGYVYTVTEHSQRHTKRMWPGRDDIVALSTRSLSNSLRSFYKIYLIEIPKEEVGDSRYYSPRALGT